MPPIRLIASALSLVANPAAAQTAAPLPKNERVGVWQAPVSATQLPLWPASVALAKPDSGARPEGTGNGTGLVARRLWHWASYVTRPTLTLYRPKGRNTGAAMLVMPGGGFEVIATDLEGTEICDWLTRLGMTCAVLKYRVPQAWPGGTRPTRLLALEDAQRAMALLRAKAGTLGIDPHRIGAIGFSAGAYLVANLSNADALSYPPRDAIDRQPTRPDVAVMLYTARLWDDGHGPNNLVLQPWARISAKAPPTLIFQAMNDSIDDVRHPMAYALALSAAGVPVDLRLYAIGGHAFGLRPTAAPITRRWPADLLRWLSDRRFGVSPRPSPLPSRGGVR
jgi:acetyl esterase/lipase